MADLGAGSIATGNKQPCTRSIRSCQQKVAHWAARLGMLRQGQTVLAQSRAARDPLLLVSCRRICWRKQRGAWLNGGRFIEPRYGQSAPARFACRRRAAAGEDVRP
jgi:hypothetical protein